MQRKAHLRVKQIEGAAVASTDGDPPTHHSQFSDANNHPLLSKEHFDCIVCSVFHKAREGQKVTDDDVPTLWRTKGSDRLRHLGTAFLFTCIPGRVHQVRPLDAVEEDANLQIFRRPDTEHRTNDCFVQSGGESSKDSVSFPFVLLGRIYLTSAFGSTSGSGLRCVPSACLPLWTQCSVRTDDIIEQAPFNRLLVRGTTDW